MLRCHKCDFYLLRKSILTLLGGPVQSICAAQKSGIETLPLVWRDYLPTGVALDLRHSCSRYA
ncbi:hypothetical protein PSAB6_10288 [Paraburkholderia sabiae]|nr:hypothetical protein PSAB6_10288 [Paraburkholderia sabiae]